MSSSSFKWRGAGPAPTRALVAAGLFALAGCNLDVVDPAIVRPDQIDDEAALPTLLAGAIGDFGVAYGGDVELGEEGVILAGGLRADEWLNTDTFDTRQQIDLGTVQPNNGSNVDVFRALQRARRSAEFAAAKYDTIASGEFAGQAEALALAGFTYILLGEHYCSGIPVSTLLPDGSFEFGQPLTTAQVFGRAIELFDDAIAVASALDATRELNLARVGKARALTDLGQFAEAATAVTGVPDDFAYEIEYSENSDRQNNAVFYFNNLNYRWGVADEEGGNGPAFVSADDPRVPTSFTEETGLDGETDIYFQDLFDSRASNIPLATGIEARLIRAEAALRAGNAATFRSIHNGLRSDVGLGALPASLTTNRQLEDAHFRERAFWLFATGHRLGDLRRQLAAPYNRSFAEVFPTGAYHKAGVNYGTDANLPVPVDEQNNPNFVECINRDR